MTENINEGERILEDFLQKASDNNEDSEEVIASYIMYIQCFTQQMVFIVT